MAKQNIISRKEKTEKFISKWAFGILFALCIQFLVYLLIINIVPTMVIKKNATEEEYVLAEINGLEYSENEVPCLNNFYQTDNYYTTNGYFKSSVENPTMFLYYYNMILLLATIILILYHLVNFMDKNEGHIIEKIKHFLKKEWPFTLLLIFMIWVFISSLGARDSYRSFIGCFNLKDGYLSFMMYGSMLICSMLLIKNNERYKKIIVHTFLITATVLAIVSLWNHFYLTSDNYERKLWYYLEKDALKDGSLGMDEVAANYLITYGDDPSKTAVTIGELLFGNADLQKGENFLIVTKRVVGGETNNGIFHNSNHYGYYLSICVIVAAVMAMKEKNVGYSILYFLAYVIMLEMAIINNTLGAYLGIVASIIFMLIYALITMANNSDKIKELSTVALIIIALIFTSTVTYNGNGKNIVYENLSGLARDLNILVDEEETINESISNGNEVKQEEKEVAEIGSGRGELWSAAWKMALKKPFFGYGLENILYEYSEQFGINEGRSHSLVFQLAATTGIVGMLLYVVAIAAIWIRKLASIKEWDLYECLGMFVIVSYIVSSLFGNSGFYTSGYFYIFVGFVALSSAKEVSVNKKEKK